LKNIPLKDRFYITATNDSVDVVDKANKNNRSYFARVEDAIEHLRDEFRKQTLVGKEISISELNQLRQLVKAADEEFIKCLSLNGETNQEFIDNLNMKLKANPDKKHSLV